LADFLLVLVRGMLVVVLLATLIMGLSNLQLPSLIATISFMAGGFIMANLILPFILSL